MTQAKYTREKLIDVTVALLILVILCCILPSINTRNGDAMKYDNSNRAIMGILGDKPAWIKRAPLASGQRKKTMSCP